MGFVALLALVIALAVPLGATGATKTLYVDNARGSGCRDSGPGTATEPLCTIVKAASIARAGDVVEVRSGTYDGTVVVGSSGTSSARIVFRAVPGSLVTVTSGTGPGFKLSSKSYVTIESFHVGATISHGITISGGTGVVIVRNDVSRAGARVDGETARGINVAGCSSCRIESNVVHDNSDHGILVYGGSTKTTVIGNETFDNARGYSRAAAGISVTNATSNVIEANVSHDNEDSGIQLRSGAAGTLVVNNRSYDNGDHGYDTLGATGARYIANVAYGNHKDGFSLESSSTGATVWNNIAIDNGLGTREYDLWVSANSQQGFASDHNIFWNSTSQVPIKWGSAKYASVDAFRVATSNEAHGIGADPLFVAASTGDFHLTEDSPAIDSADSGVSGQRSTDAAGRSRVDDPATVNTGAGPRRYDDRGALEYEGGAPKP